MQNTDSHDSSSTRLKPTRRGFLKAVAVAAASGGASAAIPGRAAECEKSVLQASKETGILKVGVTTSVPYFGFIDEHGNHAGFDYDIAMEIAKRLNVKPQVTQVTSATRIPLLQQGRVDLIASTITHYRSRDDVIDFSIDYFYTQQTMMVRRDSNIRKVSDMKGKRLGTSIGSGTVKYFKEAEPGVTIQTFEVEGDAFVALQQGLIDAMATDMTQLAGFRANAKNPNDFIVLGKEGTYGGGPFGLGLRENDSKWRDFVNYTLQDMWIDGTWDKLFNKWLGPNTKMQLTKEMLGFQMETWH